MKGIQEGGREGRGVLIKGREGRGCKEWEGRAVWEGMGRGCLPMTKFAAWLRNPSYLDHLVTKTVITKFVTSTTIFVIFLNSPYEIRHYSDEIRHDEIRHIFNWP